VVDVSAQGFTIEVDQSFGNCPKYIQARAPQWVKRPPAALARGNDGPLEVRDRELIGRADTFYIATAAAQARGHAGAQGVDVSHRGGKPGFVQMTERSGSTVLLAPDFRGNFLFNTLGNIAANPRAGLIFIDYTEGHVLQVTGRAEIIWEGPELQSFAGAHRLLQVTVASSRWFESALPLRWSAPEYAPQLDATGTWAETVDQPVAAGLPPLLQT
jgi:predicted pyridoxine 5'-phosphate oxidase superfamily flavin-nucleotide-binding protein